MVPSETEEQQPKPDNDVFDLSFKAALDKFLIDSSSDALDVVFKSQEWQDSIAVRNNIILNSLSLCFSKSNSILYEMLIQQLRIDDDVLKKLGDIVNQNINKNMDGLDDGFLSNLVNLSPKILKSLDSESLIRISNALIDVGDTKQIVQFLQNINTKKYKEIFLHLIESGVALSNYIHEPEILTKLYWFAQYDLSSFRDIQRKAQESGKDETT
ncbi:MAG: hypothetical protein AB7V32_10480, partial [Candidatus Berkiella sp.]